MKLGNGYKRVGDFFRIFLDRVDRIVDAFASIMLLFAVLVVLAQIFARVVLGKGGALPWVWESIIFFNIWITYLGAAVLSKDEKHITLEALAFFPTRIRKGCKLAARIVVLFTSYLVVLQTINLMNRQWKIPLITIPVLSRAHGTMAITIGFGLIGIYTLYNIFFGLPGKEK